MLCSALTFFIVAPLVLGAIVAVSATVGVLQLVIGNAILKGSNLPHYAGPLIAARIGAIGGGFLLFDFNILCTFLCSSLGFERTWVKLFFSVALGTATGALQGGLGCYIITNLEFYRFPWEEYGLTGGHMARAGALGGLLVGLVLHGIVHWIWHMENDDSWMYSVPSGPTYVEGTIRSEVNPPRRSWWYRAALIWGSRLEKVKEHKGDYGVAPAVPVVAVPV